MFLLCCLNTVFGHIMNLTLLHPYYSLRETYNHRKPWTVPNLIDNKMDGDKSDPPILETDETPPPLGT